MPDIQLDEKGALTYTTVSTKEGGTSFAVCRASTSMPSVCFSTDRSRASLLRRFRRRRANPTASAGSSTTPHRSTIPRAGKLLDVTPGSPQQNVEKLEKAGIIREVTGKQRHRIYVAHEIVATLEGTDEMPAPRRRGRRPPSKRRRK
jgi:hypothetical protein